jgi:hypothetical protein
VLEFEALYGKEPSIIDVAEIDSWSPITLHSINAEDSFPGLRRPRRESDHSHPTSAKFRVTWPCTSAPKYVFKALCLISYAQKQLTLLYQTMQGK